MKFTEAQMAQLTKAIAKQKETMVHDIAGTIGDAFNQTNLANAIAQAEAESYINKRVIAAQRYARLIPVDTTTQATVGTALVKGFTDAVGIGQRHSGSGDDIPLAEVIYGQQFITVDMGSIGYEFTVAELQVASRTGVALSSDKPAAARLGFERHMYQVAMVGDPRSKGKGLLNHDLPEVIISAKRLAASTPQEIVKLISDAIGLAFDEAQITGDGTSLPNTVLLPSKAYRLLNDTMMSATSTVSVLQYLKDNNILTISGVQDVSFESLPELNTAGEDSLGRIVIYRKDPDSIVFIIPQTLTFLAPQPKGLAVFTPGWYIYAGIWIKSKDAVIYIDGV